VLTVVPNRRIRITGSTYIWLTQTQKCVSEGTAPVVCKSATDGNMGRNSVSLQGDRIASSERLVSGLFTGPDAATIVIRFADTGRQQLATIVKLQGHPGWAAYYAATTDAGISHGCQGLQPPQLDACVHAMIHNDQITVYNADGGVLARLL
jgi:hypothetical protein